MQNITGKSNTLSFPVVKDLPAMQKMQEMQVQSLGQENTLKEEVATHIRILTRKIPCTEKPVGL